MLTLGIESSCDETAAAVTRNGNETLSSVVFSQVDVHKQYGGVVPELASRRHIEAVSVVIERALKEAGVGFQDIGGLAVTRGPGLIGSLLVGIAAAKGISLALGLPLVGVNHLHGHISAVALEHPDAVPPFMALIVSGGHTSLYHVVDWLDFHVVGKTRDDAAGEAFDKTAKLLGLGYPGGEIIEKLAGSIPAEEGTPLPRPLMEAGNLDFSFSGLKTAVLRTFESLTGKVRDGKRPGSFHAIPFEDESEAGRRIVRQIAVGFQKAVVEVLTSKTIWAAQQYKCDRIVVCGGVAANGALRRTLTQRGQDAGLHVFFPSLGLCTDNAAMIAARGFMLLEAGLKDDLSFDAKSRW